MKRGIKRQADTTTPLVDQVSSAQFDIPKRRESTRKVKRPKMDLPGENSGLAPVRIAQ